eukprot:4442706-Lingulodinium_polyedra.AAC.1
MLEQVVAVLTRGARFAACARAPLPPRGAMAVEALAEPASLARAGSPEREAEERSSRWVGRA